MNDSKFTLPDGFEDARAQLEGIGRLVSAKEWERSAIVSAFVRLSVVGVNLSSEISMAPTQFAALGIAGLRSENTVRLYVQAWLDTHEGTYPEPGETIDLSGLGEFPPNLSGGRSSGSMTEVRRAIDLRGADKVIELLDDGRKVALGVAVVREAVAGGPDGIRDEIERQAEVRIFTAHDLVAPVVAIEPRMSVFDILDPLAEVIEKFERVLRLITARQGDLRQSDLREALARQIARLRAGLDFLESSIDGEGFLTDKAIAEFMEGR